jgi:glycosyltransferase involved in cell wall biosynthesis
LIRVAHIITGLGVGGAETMLYKLVSSMDRASFDLEVISLMDIGPIGLRIEALGIPVRALGMRPGAASPAHLLRLARWLRQFRPDVIQTWMYHADLVGGLAAWLARCPSLAWGIRHSNLDPTKNKRSTILTAKACAKLSRQLPARIVCCSEASQQIHSRLGYDADRMIVIPNGFDLSAFHPDSSARQSVREELCLAMETPLIGQVGRFHPQKDYQTFAQAAALLHADRPDVHFVLCGDQLTWQNQTLKGWLEKAGVTSVCHLLGARLDIPRLDAAFDLAASSSSLGEGFPNVIGEAMACEVPCVVTDVGDSALIVGDTGRIAPPQSPEAFAAAWRDLLSMSLHQRQQLGRAARCRVQELFNLPNITRRYEALYKEMATSCVD